MPYLLDTDTCVAILRRDRRLQVNKVQAAAGRFAISTITLHELWAGVCKNERPGERDRLLAFCGSVVILDYDARSARYAGEIRAELELQGRKIGPLDTLIAGHAVAYNYTLVSHNVREYTRVEGLHLVDWLKE